MKSTWVIASLLLIISCQPKRKSCDFQGVAVSCQALAEQQQIALENQTLPATTTPSLPEVATENETEAPDPRQSDLSKGEVQLSIAVTLSGNKIEFLENKEDFLLLTGHGKEVDCRLSFRAGQIAYYHLSENILRVKDKGVTVTFTRKSGEKKSLIGRFSRKVSFTQGSSETTLVIENLKNLKIIKSCSVKD